MNPVLTRALQLLLLVVLQGACLFAGAGRLTWLAGWAYIGVYVGTVVLNAALMLPGGTELIAERSEYLENTRGWDRWVMLLMLLLGLGMLLVSGLDERLGWTPPLWLPLRIVAFVLMAAGFGLVSWAMHANRFFSVRVRIQEERGHAVATAGPYRFVRHPGYIGTIVYCLATPLMLGSLWAIIPAVLDAVVVVVRTALEDRTLRAELAGYTDYAEQVRYRLVPGVW
jgi:protein-S-isoprenylcysteine O-methyltransferase Ste14